MPTFEDSYHDPMKLGYMPSGMQERDHRARKMDNNGVRQLGTHSNVELTRRSSTYYANVERFEINFHP